MSVFGRKRSETKQRLENIFSGLVTFKDLQNSGVNTKWGFRVHIEAHVIWSTSASYQQKVVGSSFKKVIPNWKSSWFLWYQVSTLFDAPWKNGCSGFSRRSLSLCTWNPNGALAVLIGSSTLVLEGFFSRLKIEGSIHRFQVGILGCHRKLVNG